MHASICPLLPMAMITSSSIPLRRSLSAPSTARAALQMQSAYDDYSGKIKEQLEELETAPRVLEQLEPQRLVPERGNNGIGGRERQKVSVMGAKLDADVAGALVLDDKLPEEEHERLFQQGVRAMRSGEYKIACTAFTQAVAAYPGGMTSRKGGEYSVWLAQALHAQRRTGDAMRLLKRCESHPDKDVRTLADNVLYIFQVYARSCARLDTRTCTRTRTRTRARERAVLPIVQAPELKLGEENFMKIEMPASDDDWGRKRRKAKVQPDRRSQCTHQRRHRPPPPCAAGGKGSATRKVFDRVVP